MNLPSNSTNLLSGRVVSGVIDSALMQPGATRCIAVMPGNEVFTNIGLITTSSLSDSARAGIAPNMASHYMLSGTEHVSVININAAEAVAFAMDVSGMPRLTTLQGSSALLSSLNLTGCPVLADISLTSVMIGGVLDLRGCPNMANVNCQRSDITDVYLEGCTGLYTLALSNNPAPALHNVEECTYLHSLIVNDCQYTSLPEVPNTLTVMNCGTNPLSILDVSAYTELTELTCSQCDLTELDVSANTKLRALFCDGNSIENLDLTSNTALYSLQCGGAALTTLTMPSNAATRMDNVRITSASMTSLDFRNYTRMRTLNVIGCTSLTSLQLTACTGLYTLNCNSCTGLTSLDVTGLTNLYYLTVSGVPLGTGAGLTGLASLTGTAGSTAHSIYLQQCSLSAAQLDDIFTQLPTKTTGYWVWTIYIKNNPSVGDTSGTTGCDKTIATNKGWVVNTTN